MSTVRTTLIDCWLHFDQGTKSQTVLPRHSLPKKHVTISVLHRRKIASTQRSYMCWRGGNSFVTTCQIWPA